MPVSGNDLKVERTRANLTITEIAARMGLSRQALWAIERAAVVDPRRVEEYRTALVTPRDGTEPSQAAATA